MEFLLDLSRGLFSAIFAVLILLSRGLQKAIEFGLTVDIHGKKLTTELELRRERGRERAREESWGVLETLKNNIACALIMVTLRRPGL